MFNPKDPEQFHELTTAVTDSIQKMEPFRDKRTELLSLFVGSEYSNDGEPKKVYLNMISLALNIYVRQLVVRAPNARVTTPFQELRPMAANFALACEDVAEETKLGQTLRRAVTEAIFAPMATVKVGLEVSGTKKLYDEDVDLTDPFVKLVSFDDYVRDMSARSAYEPGFEGDTYYLTKHELNELYPDIKKKFGKDIEDDLSIQTEYGSDRAESMSHRPTSGNDNWNGKVSVRDIWLPKERLLITYLPSMPDKPLNIREYDGPDGSPYHSLWFTGVPDNALPLAPFSVLKNIQLLANNLFRRLSHQAKVQKRVVGFSDENSANRFKNAHDGDGIYWEGQKPEELDSGGIDQRSLAFLIQVKDMFAWAAGNLDSLGGLSPTSETAKQDEMLSQSANAQLADMQDSTTAFAKGIFEQIAWYEWTDPVRERTLQKNIPNTDMSLPVKWDLKTRQGDFLDFNFNINPMSMREDNPAQKIQKIQAALMNIFLPMQPFMQQQGLTVNAKRLAELVADYSGLPELEQLIVSVDPNVVSGGNQEPQGDPTPSTKPAQTKRTYERINRPGATRGGKDAAMISTLLGAKVQQAETDAITRGVS